MNREKLATDIVKRLVVAGYIAYFAGGWVRDCLMGHPSDDVDIATNAPPEKILDLFPHTILVGLSFGVIIVVFEGHQFEVATFRRDIDYVDGRKPTMIELASPEEDAARRDFTINGMFYDPLEDVVYDFVQGQEDIQLKLIRTIGDPYDRFFEDRLRMVRAVRFASRFEFAIDEETRKAILANADTLFPAVAIERIWQELVKMSKYPHFDGALIELHRLGLLPVIFPILKGVHLTEIKERVAHFKYFSDEIEAPLQLMELFPKCTLLEAIEICRYLKMSVHDQKKVEFLIRLRQLVADDVPMQDRHQEGWDKVTWAHIYANKFSKHSLELIGAKVPDEKRVQFVLKHNYQRDFLEAHIQRIVQQKPLVNASLLQENGVAPGKVMGRLLKEAEKVSIVDGINDPLEVIKILKTSELWPKTNF